MDGQLEQVKPSAVDSGKKMEKGYTDLIDEALAANSDEFDAFPLRPSSSGKCSRALAFETGAHYGLWELPKINKDPSVKRLLSLGSSVEWHSIKNFDLIAKQNTDLRIKYRQQALPLFTLKHDGPLPVLIEGSLDLAVVNSTEGWCDFGDVKSAKDKFSYAFKTYWDENIAKFNSLKSLVPLSTQAWYAADLPSFLEELQDPFFEDNFRQLNAYCCSEFFKQHGGRRGFIYRYNKNDSRHIEIQFAPSEALYEEFKNKCQWVFDNVKARTFEQIAELGCDYPLGHIKRAFCDCVKYAGEDADASLKAFFRTFPEKKWPTDIKDKGLVGLFEEYETAEAAADIASDIQFKITKALGERKLGKVRLPNGHVYEVKYLKTGGPRNGPRADLRRSKA